MQQSLERLRITHDFGTLLVARREVLGISRTELAQTLNVEEKDIMMMESNQLSPHTSALWSLCETLDVDPAELLWSLRGSAERGSAEAQLDSNEPPEFDPEFDKDDNGPDDDDKDDNDPDDEDADNEKAADQNGQSLNDLIFGPPKLVPPKGDEK